MHLIFFFHRYTQNKSSFGVFRDVKSLRGSVECKMIEERETLFMELHHVGAELVSSGSYIYREHYAGPYW